MSDKKCIYDPLTEIIKYYETKKIDSVQEVKNENLSVEERLKNRVIDGNKANIEGDINEALKIYKPLEIINTILLEGMKIVGELFGSGQMQLPFVLQSAEVMKAAVTVVEPYMEKADTEPKGKMVLATVKGDVHDIGKNLVDIILTNNGYTVYNLGIKIGIEEILEACDKFKADAIGMSGLLVKSTLIMKENLEVMKERGYNVPVILGGAALTKRFVEQDLRAVYGPDVYYAQDAISGLNFMNKLMSGTLKSETPEIVAEETLEDRLDLATGSESKILTFEDDSNIKSNIVPSETIPNPPFWGTKVVENIEIETILPFINKTALFRGQWQFRRKGKSEEEFNQLINDKAEPVFESLKAKVKIENLLNPKVVYGYYPCNSDGNDLIVYKPKDDKISLNDVWSNGGSFTKSDLTEWKRFSFPRQVGKKHLCISDYYNSVDSGKIDVVSFQIVTVGSTASEYAQKLFKDNLYSDYLFFHGMSVESAEALAEYWHKKVREDLSIADKDAKDIQKMFQQGYQGSRYSFGYPACPNLEDQEKLFDMMKPERIGVVLSEGFQMHPEQSTSAIILYHPVAKYFFL